MVTAVMDQIRVPTLSLSQGEIQELEELIMAGQLPPDFIDRHLQAVQDNVFGHDHKTTRQGDPIEQGIGSAGNQTANSVAAYIKYCSEEPDFEENLKRLRADLAKCDTVRKEKAAAAARKRTKRINA